MTAAGGRGDTWSRYRGRMRILHLSDTHLYADDASRHYERIDTAAALSAVLERLAGLEDIDLLVHSGDASEDGTAGSYRRLHALLDPFAQRLGAPVVVAMGNHDSSRSYAEVRGPGDRGDAVQDRVLDLPGGTRVITLDTSVPGAGYGVLDDEQIAWLSEVLATPAGGGTVLTMHHPPLAAHTPLLRALELQDPDALGAVLADSDVRVILAGHYHHPLQGALAGIPVHVAPGITNVMDPLESSGVEQAHALSGASIVELTAGQAPAITSTVWPNAGDAGEAGTPVYRFDRDTVRRIIEDAGG